MTRLMGVVLLDKGSGSEELRHALQRAMDYMEGSKKMLNEALGFDHPTLAIAASAARLKIVELRRTLNCQGIVEEGMVRDTRLNSVTVDKFRDPPSKNKIECCGFDDLDKLYEIPDNTNKEE